MRNSFVSPSAANFETFPHLGIAPNIAMDFIFNARVRDIKSERRIETSCMYRVYPLLFA